MEKKVVKIKLNTLITILVISILVISGVIALILCNQNEGNNIDLIDKETTNNEESFIKIRYAYSYNVSTADALNNISDNGKYIDILEIELKDEVLEKINSLLEKQSYKKVEDLELAIIDVYEVNINDEIKLLICPGEKYAQYTKGNESFLIKISEEFVNEIDKIVQKEASKNIRKFSSEKITIISEGNKQLIITEEKDITQLNENSKYTKVNINAEDLSDEKISYILDLNNGTKVCVYADSCLGYVTNENGDNYYVAFMGNYEKVIQKILENYISERNEKF